MTIFHFLIHHPLFYHQEKAYMIECHISARPRIDVTKPNKIPPTNAILDDPTFTDVNICYTFDHLIGQSRVIGNQIITLFRYAS